MQVKHATAATATESHAAGKTARPASFEASDFGSLLSLLESPATEASEGSGAQALEGEGDASECDAERKDDSAPASLADGREMQPVAAMLPMTVALRAEPAVQGDAIEAVTPGPVSGDVAQDSSAALPLAGEAQVTGVEARAAVEGGRAAANRSTRLDLTGKTPQTTPSAGSPSTAAAGAARDTRAHGDAGAAPSATGAAPHTATGAELLAIAGNPAAAASGAEPDPMLRGGPEQAAQMPSFHVEQLLGHVLPEAPSLGSSLDEGVLDGLALRGPETVGGGRPRFDVVAQLSAELQGALPSVTRTAHGGRSQVSGKGGRHETDPTPLADLPGFAAAAPSARVLNGNEAPTAASSPSPVPLATLVPEVVRVASALADARKSGTLETTNVVEMRLDPPVLGSLYVRVVEEQGVVNAFVTVSNPAMEKVLAAEMTHLSTHLAHHGIVLGQVTVGTDGSGGHSSGRPPEASTLDGPARVRRGGAAAVSSEPARAAPQPSLYGGRAVNLRA